MSRPRGLAVLFGIGLFTLVGCSHGLQREPVSGTVKYKGKPIVIGSVTFVPVPEGGATYPNAVIRDGKFNMTATDGPVAGRYKLRFSGYDKEVLGPVNPGSGPTPEPPKEILPARYTADSTYEVDVKVGGPNVFDINLD